MAITPTQSLLAALSSLGTDGVRPRPAPESVRPPAAPTPPGPTRAQHTAAVPTTAPDPARPLPRGSLINIVV
jgi:hypothetical protein